MYHKILVPLDGSELSEKVLPHVETLARCTGAEIILIRAIIQPFEGASSAASMTGYMPVMLPDVKEQVHEEAVGYLNKIKYDLSARGLRVSTIVQEGDAGEVILEYARHEDVDLIAMSTHGRTGLGRALFGSVAEEVLRGAGKPVMLIRPS